jgi:O-acetyl-ADP-ribose deacetylase (regulator of RNase III)
MAEIQEIHGNLFTSPCAVVVNTVNCVGVMGAGVALECRYRFPGLFEYYEPFCLSGQLQPGKLLLFRGSTPQILCFPTKKHWKDPAQVSYIEAGLEKFSATYQEKGIESIAFPHLGCSHGGLSWDDQVRPIMYRHLSPLMNLRVEIYSFDPHAADPLFDQLCERLRGVSRPAIATTLDLRTQQVNRLMDAIESGGISNMLALQQSDGVGPKTTIKVYEFLHRTNRAHATPPCPETLFET